MKLMIVNHRLHGGGAEFVGRVWARELSARGHEITYVTTDEVKEQRLLPDAVMYYKIGFRTSAIRRVWRLAQLYRDLQPDYVLAMQTYPAIAALLAGFLTRTQRRIIVSERNMPSLILHDAGLAEVIQYWLARIVYRRAGAAFAISHSVAADLVSAFRVKPSRCIVVPNPASDKRTKDAPAGPRREPEHARTLTIVLPFRMSKQKNPTLAIEVAAELGRRGWAIDVQSFGTGELTDTVAATAARLKVDYVAKGWRENWFEEVGPQSVVLLPSSYEGFGNVLVEAAGAGVPSVAASTSLGVSDAIVPEVTGQLAATLDPSDLADAVERASMLDLSGPAVAAWLSRFSTESSVEQLERALRAVAASA